jgi:hypothetical protein
VNKQLVAGAAESKPAPQIVTFLAAEPSAPKPERKRNLTTRWMTGVVVALLLVAAGIGIW